jgi:hypothetical protein
MSCVVGALNVCNQVRVSEFSPSLAMKRCEGRGEPCDQFDRRDGEMVDAIGDNQGGAPSLTRHLAVYVLERSRGW